MRTDLPKRFYREAHVVDRPEGFAIALDGKLARTPAKSPLAVASRRLAEAMAAEWNAQGALIDPGAMPLTRIVNATLDGVAWDLESVAAEVVKYAGSDLLCYRAEAPDELVRRQSDAWDPLLEWAGEVLDAPLLTARGIVFVEQPASSLAAIAREVGALDSYELAAVSVMTTLTGSVVVALAVAKGRLEAEAAWSAANIDEDYQIELWGQDEEALARREARWREMDAASRLIELTRQA
jgi:chaperone required for assembly of F1-ATPase